ncbi:MAG TPA: hybrid sensor histidine kinase/response regulator [Cyanobacteria bacterium UBA8803]|nr:hybrid sensor histidine kinase/response regulator [Cyanobacteria bacterium UBA9273]HBL58295.1 hybrid sensor histidine kinase/response regulator [Cyanobacteria bacterium UBA8803]
MTPAKILIVDDEVELERLIKQRLRKKIIAKEIELIFARNGQEALEILKSDRPIDMVLTDINMPEMDGLTLLDKLHEIDVNIKAVVISAYGDMKNIRTAMNSGAFDFITKPINFEDLNTTINKTLTYVKQIRETVKQLQQAQLQLIQSEKMATLGQLVAGVAHEINNPLSCIAGYAGISTEAVKNLLEHLRLYQEKFINPGPEIEEDAEKIKLDYIVKRLPIMFAGMVESTDRLIDISNSLRTFSRADTDAMVLANIHEGIDSTLMILQHRLKANNHRPEIQVRQEYGDIPAVQCYLGQLNQVFMNILVNAIDACEATNEGRTFGEIKANPNIITIQTELVQDPESVIIKIKDNGQGMSGEVKSRIFDPLFTTKAVGKGTGLGLSISRQIVVETHGGSMSCHSVLGEGTVFIIAIPRSAGGMKDQG